VSRTCDGLPPFDIRGWWTLRDAQAMMTACGPAGRTAYAQQQLVDLAYPAVLAGLLLVATALLVRPYGYRWWPVLVPAVAMTVLDYVENIGVWTLLLDWPDTHPAVITIAATATAVKRVLGFVAFTTPLLLALTRLATVIRQHGPTARRFRSKRHQPRAASQRHRRLGLPRRRSEVHSFAWPFSGISPVALGSRGDHAKDSSEPAVSGPPALPVFTTPAGSMRSACTSPSAMGQCSTPRGTTKS
jgi:hypothetical protein